MTDHYQWRGLIKAVAAVRYPFFFLFVYINSMNNSTILFPGSQNYDQDIYTVYCSVKRLLYCDVLGYGAENLFSSMTATTVPDKVKFPLFKFFIYLHFYKVNKSNYYCV